MGVTASLISVLPVRAPCHGGLDDPGGVLTLLGRQRSNHSETNSRLRYDELLPTHAPSPCDPHALREHLVHDVLQERSSPAMSNDGESREAGVVGLAAFAAASDNDAVTVRRWM